MWCSNRWSRCIVKAYNNISASSKKDLETFENLKIIEIAKKISTIIPSKILIKKNIDPRSYRLNSDKLLSTGFVQNFSVNDAIKEIKEKYQSKKFRESSKCYTVKWMKKINLK